MGSDLTGEDLLITEVICDTAEVCRVAKGERWQRRAVVPVPPRPFLREMHRITHAPAVTAGHEAAIRLKDAARQVDEAFHRV